MIYVYRLARFAAAISIVLMTSAAISAFADQAMILQPHPEPLVAHTSGGPVSFVVEIADEEAERSRGLMFRRNLPADRGMLFVFEETGRRGFWMRNTPLPLDLLFVAESGRVVAIRRGEPFSEKTIAPIYPVRFVLELNEGTARQTGIGIGDRLRHPLIDAISGVN